MTDTQKLYKSFDWIIDTVMNFKNEKPLEWSNEGFYLNKKRDVKFLTISDGDSLIIFQITYEQGNQLALIITRDYFTFEYKLFTRFDTFIAINETRCTTLNDLYKNNFLFRKPLNFLVKVGILETDTLKFKGYNHNE